MNKIVPLLAVSLLTVSTMVGAETKFKPAIDNMSIDLRYCLALPTVQLIAKCSGEVSAGKKGTPFSPEEVARIISEENAKLPSPARESSAIPLPISDIPKKVSQPEEE